MRDEFVTIDNFLSRFSLPLSRAFLCRWRFSVFFVFPNSLPVRVAYCYCCQLINRRETFAQNFVFQFPVFLLFARTTPERTHFECAECQSRQWAFGCARTYDRTPYLFASTYTWQNDIGLEVFISSIDNCIFFFLSSFLFSFYFVFFFFFSFSFGKQNP